MSQAWSRFSVVVLLAASEACWTSGRVADAGTEKLSGCLRRIYADGPPGSRAGGVLYTLTTDAGSTRLLDVSPEQLVRAGGASAVDGTRVSVVLAPSPDSSTAGARLARVREINREPSTSGAPC
jgi:hypothetical protein